MVSTTPQEGAIIFIRPCLRLILAAIFLLGGNAFGQSAPAEKTADIVIYGGTSAGVAAAVQASRESLQVILVEPGAHPGGLTSGGLGFTDSGDKRVIGGISREFYQRVKKWYDLSDAWKFEASNEYGRYDRGSDAMWTFEPHVAERVFGEMLAETNVDVLLNQRIDRSTGVKLRNGRISSLRMESGLVLEAAIFIDASYEGDVMALAGVPFTVGRESNSVYGETLNGNQVAANTHKHRFLENVSPWLVKDDPNSGLLPGIDDSGPGTDGEGDHLVQAYCFRMCMSRVPQNRVPFPKPAGYQESDYELLLRNFEAGDHRLPLKIDMMPNGKTDTNNNCAVSTDFIGANYGYAEAGYAERDEIIRKHIEWQQGLMWTLANHPRVPAGIRQEMAEWGLAKDEFTDNGNWPHQLYVREARRMVSDYVLTELDCRRERICDDSVGLGSYNMDSHNVRRYVTPEGFVQNEGDVQVSPGGPYLISYRCIVPPAGKAENLLVPVCLSASHIAYGSVRMEPVFMVLGHSAASAAAIAIERQCAVQDVPYSLLRAKLLADSQELDLPADVQKRQTISAARLPGNVADDVDAVLTGLWSTSSATSSFVGAGYRHDGNTAKGEASAEYTLQLSEPGRYEVRVSYSAHSNRASNVPVKVTFPGGSIAEVVNQRRAPEIDELLQPVATIMVPRDAEVSVRISNAGTNGHVIIDAVQAVFIDESR